MIASKEKILITGAGGQLGIELARALVEKYGYNSVIATDINPKACDRLKFSRFESLDVLNENGLKKTFEKESITQVFHLAAILSANGENDPLSTWDISMRSLLLILELSRRYKFKLFWPSSIAVFGLGSDLDKTPQNSPGIPSTVYGLSKRAGEYWCNYYYNKYGVDVRSVRYPGLIGYKSLPGGGTTDYAVDIFYKALSQENFTCFLSSNRRLPMMYMPDAISAALKLMEAPTEKIAVRTSYNIAGISFAPSDIYECLKDYFPEFQMDYEADYRDDIAKNWPRSIDDRMAYLDWGWAPEYCLKEMVSDMVKNLQKLGF